MLFVQEKKKHAQVRYQTKAQYCRQYTAIHQKFKKLRVKPHVLITPAPITKKRNYGEYQPGYCAQPEIIPLEFFKHLIRIYF
jgi:hypothetical protein